MNLALARALLATAASGAGVDPGAAELIRLGENAVFRLPGAVVARVSREGQVPAARHEVEVARWLEEQGVPAVRVAPGHEDVVEVSGHAVSFWAELPPHRPADFPQIAGALRRLHALTSTGAGLRLRPLEPLVRVEERLLGSALLSDEELTFLLARLDDLRERFVALPPGLPSSPVHGDAWSGNVVATDTGEVVLLDLERFSQGPPEWDLVSTAVRFTSYGTMTRRQYEGFRRAYGGYDVLEWAGFETLRDVRELRVVTYALQLAAEDPSLAEQARLRVKCLRAGDRPWPGWRAL